MQAAAEFAFPPQREPALMRAFVLAAVMHGVLIGLLFVGVRFQSRAPDTVEVELWEPPSPAPPEVKPVPPPPPPPKAVEPEKPSPKPDIAVAEKPKPKPKPKPEAKAKPEPKRDKDFEKRMREQLAQEQQVVAQADAERRERELKALIAKREANARSKALAEWQDKIRIRIRGYINLPPDIAGNPEAVFDVALLPTGEVLPGSVKLRRPSGHAAYDEAVHRAILRASPLPKPDDPRLFVRQLELRFRPQDK